MARLWIIGAALCCWAGIVYAGTTACEDATNIVNEAANELLAAYDQIKDNPGMNVSTIMGTMCQAPNKAKMVAIEQAIPTCIELMSTIQTNLTLIEIGGMPFLTLFTIFLNVQEVCDCSMYLDHAFMLRSMPPTMDLPDGHFQKIVDAGKVCSTMTTVQMPVTTKDLIMYVDNSISGTTTCPRLWSIAGISTKMQFDAIVAFAQDRCPTFDKTKFDCTVAASKTQMFKTCMANVESTTSDAGGKSCSRYECVMKQMTTCGAAAYNNFIAVVSATQENTNMKISNADCNAATNIQLSALAMMLILLVSLLN